MTYQPGDMISVRKNCSVNFGIYAGGGRVLCLEKTLRGAVVKDIDIGEFIGPTGSAHIDQTDDAAFDPLEVVARARSLEGMQPIPKFITNSESFATWAKTGAPRNSLYKAGREASVGLLNAFLQKPVKEYVKLARTDVALKSPKYEKQFKQDVKNIYNKMNKY